MENRTGYLVEHVEQVLQARVVGYELLAFTDAYLQVGGAPENVVLSGLILDGCLVHARCCIEFLVGRLQRSGRRSHYETDISASTLLGAEWEPLPALHVDYLDGQLPLIDKHLSHVTTDRAALFGHRWDLDRLSAAIWAVMAAYCARLEEDAPQRWAQLAGWVERATDCLGQVEQANRHSVGSPMSVMLVLPAGASPGVWAAWIQRYVRDRRLGPWSR